MPEEKDVNVDSSPTGDSVFEEIKKDVSGQEPSPDAVSQDTQDTDVSSTQDVKPEVKDTRPIDNVAWEAKRKVDELLPKVDKILEHISTVGQAQQAPPPKYSKAELMTFASAPDTPIQDRRWAYEEVEKIEKAERQRELQEIMRSTQEKTEGETKRAQSAQWVAQNFPDMIIKDSLGNPVGWNQGHPVLMKANEYMGRSKELQTNPEGLVAAVKMAAFDLGVHLTNQTQQKLSRTTGQLRKEQKKQLVSSGGTRPVENAQQLAKNKLAKLQEAYKVAQKNPNNSQESTKIFAEIVKLRGLNPFFGG